MFETAIVHGQITTSWIGVRGACKHRSVPSLLCTVICKCDLESRGKGDKYILGAHFLGMGGTV